MQKIISLILLAALLIGMLTLAACQPPRIKRTRNSSARKEIPPAEPRVKTDLISRPNINLHRQGRRT